VPPAHIALETQAGEAVWISAMGVQVVRLDALLQRPIPNVDALPKWLPIRRDFDCDSRTTVDVNPDPGRVRTPGGSLVPADE
jgi:hypothetical protein